MTGLKIIDGTPTEISKYLREREMTNKLKKEIKECIDSWARELGIFEGAELVNVPDIVDLENEINKLIGEKEK